MKLKITTALVLSTCLSVSSYFSAFANEVPGLIGCVDSGTSTRIVLPVGEPVYEHLSINSRAATINVDITSPCDQKFRSAYSDYNYEANRIVERSDDYLYTEFGIDFYSVAQPLWTTTATDYVSLINDAKSKFGLKYNGSQTADIMMAFSGVSVSEFGSAYIGTPYGCIYNTNYDQNAKSTQHEFGHIYGLDHHTASDACVMKQGSDTSLIDKLCSTHKTQWSNAKNKY